MLGLRANSLIRAGGRGSNFVTRRHAHQHRTIQVQLKSDVPGLGGYGTIQTVSPGRMRNHLFPKGLANYILKGAEPAVLPSLSSKRPKSLSLEQSINLSDLTAKINTSLPNHTLTIYRRIIHTDPQSSLVTSGASADLPHGAAIYGSVSSHDILLALSEALEISNVTSQNISIIIPDSIHGGKLRATGEYLVHAQLPKVQGANTVELKVVIKDSGARTTP